jgi:hypothetical protein
MYDSHTSYPYQPTKDDTDAIRYLDNQLSGRQDTDSSQFRKNFGRGRQMLEATAAALYSNIDFRNYF